MKYVSPFGSVPRRTAASNGMTSCALNVARRGPRRLGLGRNDGEKECQQAEAAPPIGERSHSPPDITSSQLQLDREMVVRNSTSSVTPARSTAKSSRFGLAADAVRPSAPCVELGPRLGDDSFVPVSNSLSVKVLQRCLQKRIRSGGEVAPREATTAYRGDGVLSWPLQIDELHGVAFALALRFTFAALAGALAAGSRRWRAAPRTPVDRSPLPRKPAPADRTRVIVHGTRERDQRAGQPARRVGGAVAGRRRGPARRRTAGESALAADRAVDHLSGDPEVRPSMSVAVEVDRRRPDVGRHRAGCSASAASRA